MQYKFNINAISDSSLLNDETPVESVRVVPSTLMRSPSDNFARAFKFVAGDGFYTVDINVNSDNNSILEITNIKAFVNSNIGRHYLEVLEPHKITLDLSDEEDGDKKVYIGVDYHPNDTEAGEFILDELVTEIISDTSTPSLSYAVEVANISISNGVIDSDSIQITAEQLSLTNQASSMIVQDYGENIEDNVQKSLENLEDGINKKVSLYHLNSSETIRVADDNNALVINPMTFDEVIIGNNATLKFID
jgi:hypothetical protein